MYRPYQGDNGGREDSELVKLTVGVGYWFLTPSQTCRSYQGDNGGRGGSELIRLSPIKTL